ncbi:MAG: hypothetical protein M1819_000365 [Sarea resinae]|nr:MAG: hypothetical protein M1819_000365 [Sarea resinae]
MPPPPPPPLQNIALIGANGHLGPAILTALLSAPASPHKFNVTVLSRASSASNPTYPSSVRTTLISPDPSVDELVRCLRGCDALIVAVSGALADLQMRLADAAARAGVRRFVPADFGSCDSRSARAAALVPLYGAKGRVRAHLRTLAAAAAAAGEKEGEGEGEDDTGFSWTSLVCGHFFDYGLRTGLLGFEMGGAKKAKVFDGGHGRWSATTLEAVGRAVVGVLRHEAETRNRMLYIQSFCTTQNEVLASLEKATATTTATAKTTTTTRGAWRVEEVESGPYIEKLKAEMERDPGNNAQAAEEELVGVLGLLEADWSGKEDFANELLGLGGEDLDEVVQKVVATTAASESV